MKKRSDPCSDPSSQNQTKIAFEARMSRLMQAAGAKNDSELARALGITPQSVGPARSRLQIPAAWVERISEISGNSSDWIFFGRGTMCAGNTPNLQQNTPEKGDTTQTACPRCSTLEEELRIERREQKELAAENRQLHRDKEALLRENGELREKVARLEERKRRYELTHGFPAESSGIGS